MQGVQYCFENILFLSSIFITQNKNSIQLCLPTYVYRNFISYKSVQRGSRQSTSLHLMTWALKFLFATWTCTCRTYVNVEPGKNISRVLHLSMLSVLWYRLSLKSTFLVELKLLHFYRSTSIYHNRIRNMKSLQPVNSELLKMN